MGMCFNYSTNIRILFDIKKLNGNYLQKTCHGHSGPLLSMHTEGLCVGVEV